MEKNKFKELFPHLADELENGSSNVDLRAEADEKRRALNTDRRWAGYYPDIIDFIRRCETVEQAAEIIEYLVNKGEVSSEMADELRKQLEDEGIRSFGKQKEAGYYHKNAR
jgi:hypothetical protein